VLAISSLASPTSCGGILCKIYEQDDPRTHGIYEKDINRGFFAKSVVEESIKKIYLIE